MRIVYKNGPPSHLMRVSSVNRELRTDNFINSGNSIDCAIIVQSLPYFLYLATRLL